MSINLSALMKQRYDTAANWTGQNPTLLAGEIGIESDTKKWKVGTGSTAWTSLVYAIGGTYPIVNADVAAAAGIVDTKLATIATAGKVSNSATTAASANTASAIVARDASGNFTAGTITAALTGAASSNVLKAGDTMTGVLAVTAGTAALPGIAVSGDTNTGIYSPGADQIGISTGGTSRLVVDASGNVNIDSNTLYVDAANNRVGIGTSSPNTALDVNGTINVRTNNFQFGRITTNNVTGDIGGLTFQYNNTGTFTNGIVLDGAGNVNIDSNTLYVDAVNNRVGIGTTASNANGGVLQLSSGITFPATAVAASDVNTLDDYEEGTWTPTQGAGLTVVGAFASSGHYTKVGRQVTIQGYVGAATSVTATTNQILCGGLPFVAKSAANAQCIGSAANGTTINALINVLVNQGSSDVYAVTTMAATAAIYFTVSYLT